MKNMFTLRSTSYNLRGNYILTLPVPKRLKLLLMAFVLFLIMAPINGTHCGTFFELPILMILKKALASPGFMYI